MFKSLIVLRSWIFDATLRNGTGSSGLFFFDLLLILLAKQINQYASIIGRGNTNRIAESLKSKANALHNNDALLKEIESCVSFLEIEWEEVVDTIEIKNDYPTTWNRCLQSIDQSINVHNSNLIGKAA